MVIVGNKSDQTGLRCVDKDEIRDIVSGNGMGGVVDLLEYIDEWDDAVVEVSAKRLDLVQELFARVAKVGMECVGGAERPGKVHDFSIDLREAHRGMGKGGGGSGGDGVGGGCAC